MVPLVAILECLGVLVDQFFGYNLSPPNQFKLGHQLTQGADHVHPLLFSRQSAIQL
jgi:hypothetical protein